MPTIRASATTHASRPWVKRIGAFVVLLGGLAIAAPVAVTGSTARPAHADDATTIEAVGGSATALAPAKRLALDESKPIFPMETTPRCNILDNFGDGRSGGRVHQGTDILATLGQDVYAPVTGRLGHQVINGGPGSSLSGNSWRIYAAIGPAYYVVMHLSGFAPGLKDGDLVKQGQVIGYVGDTGNPGPGNYHLHFEVHPTGTTEAVNALTVLPIPPECTVT